MSDWADGIARIGAGGSSPAFGGQPSSGVCATDALSMWPCRKYIMRAHSDPARARTRIRIRHLFVRSMRALLVMMSTGELSDSTSHPTLFISIFCMSYLLQIFILYNPFHKSGIQPIAAPRRLKILSLGSPPCSSLRRTTQTERSG